MIFASMIRSLLFLYQSDEAPPEEAPPGQRAILVAPASTHRVANSGWP